MMFSSDRALFYRREGAGGRGQGTARRRYRTDGVNLEQGNHALAIFQEGQESLAGDPSRSYQPRYDVPPNFIVFRDNQRASYACLLQLYVAAFLTSVPVPDLLKNANQFLPRQRN